MKELDDDKSESSNSQITSEEEKDSDDDEDISQDEDGSVDAGELVATIDTIAGQTAGSASNKRRGGFIVN